jgi:hypothetical protein
MRCHESLIPAAVRAKGAFAEELTDIGPGSTSGRLDDELVVLRQVGDHWVGRWGPCFGQRRASIVDSHMRAHHSAPSSCTWPTGAGTVRTVAARPASARGPLRTVKRRAASDFSSSHASARPASATVIPAARDGTARRAGSREGENHPSGERRRRTRTQHTVGRRVRLRHHERSASNHQMTPSVDIFLEPMIPI